MNRASALAFALLLAGGAAAVLLAPAWLAGTVAALAALGLRRGRTEFLAFAATGILLHVALLALFSPGPDPWRLGPLALGADGALRGLAAGARLAAAAGLALALFSWLPPVRLLEGLRLHPRAAGILGATLLGAQDAARDFERLVLASRLEGAWPRRLPARARAAAALLPALLVAAHRRAEVRRDALRLAGIATGPRFVPLVAVTALAVAGRLAFLALPNVALTYVVIFLGGVLFGPAVGVLAGAFSMALTDLMLTGLALPGFANVPAMALLGAFGGLLGSRGVPDRGWAAVAGVLGTLLFSLGADVGEWAAVPELRRAGWAGLQARWLSGLAFNLVPAAVNGALFAAAVVPVSAAFRALRAGGPTG